MKDKYFREWQLQTKAMPSLWPQLREMEVEETKDQAGRIHARTLNGHLLIASHPTVCSSQ